MKNTDQSQKYESWLNTMYKLQSVLNEVTIKGEKEFLELAWQEFRAFYESIHCETQMCFYTLFFFYMQTYGF